MKYKTKKATFNLRTDVLIELDRAMAYGEVSSKNALVERALVNELRELRRKNRRKLWQVAVEDPLFLRDITETEEAFFSADTEISGIID